MARLAVAVVLSHVLVTSAFYPPNHWQHVHRLNSRNFEETIRREVDAGKTVFAPAWNAVAAKYKADADIVFGEINWSEEHFDRAFGARQGAGDGGWPTIRYFNKGTGYGGKGYKQKTNEELDAELGNEDRMEQYLQDKSGRSNCDVVWGTDCSEIELKYIDKWVGPNAARDQQKLSQEKVKWEKELSSPPVMKNFAQNKQRVMILGRLIDAWQNANL